MIDRSDHASIVDGCRLGFGKIHKFRHNDLSSLERALRLHDATGKLIIVDGIYSMEGDIADVPGLVEIFASAKRIVVPELNMGQLARLLTSEYPQFRFEAYHKVKGKPFMAPELKVHFAKILEETA